LTQAVSETMLKNKNLIGRPFYDVNEEIYQNA
jgi:hypothetical protein